MSTQNEPYLIPLNAIFSTDFCQVLVPIMSNNTIDELAGAVAANSEGLRVPKRDLPKIVMHEGKILPGDITVAEAGIAPLDHVRVEYQE